jgi:membrane protein
MPEAADKPLSFLQRLRAFLFGAVQGWFDDRASSKGAALAYYTLFSLAPLLVIVIAIAGAVFGREAATGAIFDQLNGLVGPTGAEAIQMLLANARNPKAGVIATIIAIAVLLIGATTAFGELKDSLDEIWHVPPSRQPGIIIFIRTRLLSFGLILVLVFLLLVSLSVSAALAAVQKSWGSYWSDASYIAQMASSLVSFAVIATLFAAIYKLLPQIKLSWHDVWIGAFLTAALFMLGKNLIGLYLGNSGVAGSYGAAGSIVALLLWVYYSAQIFFLGAEFTRHYALWFGSLRNSPDHHKDRKAA